MKKEFPEYLSKAAQTAMKKHHIEKLDDLIEMSYVKLSSWKGVGPGAIKKIQEDMEQRGMRSTLLGD